MRKPVPGGRAQHRDLIAHGLRHRHGIRPHRAEVKKQIDHGKLDLAQDRDARHEMARPDQLAEQLWRQRQVRLDLPRQVGEHRMVPREIFEQLVRQLDRVPLEPARAGDARPIDLGEQMVQHVPPFMKQRDDIVMRQQRRPVRTRSIGSRSAPPVRQSHIRCDADDRRRTRRPKAGGRRLPTHSGRDLAAPPLPAPPKREHLAAVRRHLGFERQGDVIGIPKQRRRLATEREDPRHSPELSNCPPHGPSSDARGR